MLLPFLDVTELFGDNVLASGASLRTPHLAPRPALSIHMPFVHVAWLPKGVRVPQALALSARARW